MRSEAFKTQKKTHLGCRYERGEYERGRHSRGTGEQVRLAALRPLVQREWLSASQLLCVHLKKARASTARLSFVVFVHICAGR
jgi:hypothetical protein